MSDETNDPDLEEASSLPFQDTAIVMAESRGLAAPPNVPCVTDIGGAGEQPMQTRLDISELFRKGPQQITSPRTSADFGVSATGLDKPVLRRERYSEQRERRANRALERRMNVKTDDSIQAESLSIWKMFSEAAAANVRSTGIPLLASTIGANIKTSDPPGVNQGGSDGASLTATDLEAQWKQEEQDRRNKKTAEAQEAETNKLAEEERVKAEEEEAKQRIEDLKQLEEFRSYSQQRLSSKAELHQKNMSASDNHPEECFFTKLDSSLKKNTAFVKKIKVLTESQKDAICKDFQTLNLTKYIGEVATAIVEAKLKMSDIPAAIHICSLLHQRYADFSTHLLENWGRCLISRKDGKVANPSKYRVDLRFFAELISSGVLLLKSGLSVLANQLAALVNNDKDEHNNLPILSSFCKHCGDDYAGLIPRKYREFSEKYGIEIPRSQLLRPERQKACRNLIRDYFVSLCKHLTKDHKTLRGMERQNRKILQTKGELSSERKDSYEGSLNMYQKLYASTSTFADLVDEEMPDLPEEDLKQDSEMALLDIYSPMKGEYEYQGDSSLFEDEDTRMFYESMSDLKALIPGILYKESEQNPVADEANDDMTALEDDLEELKVEDVEKEMETEKILADAESKERQKAREGLSGKDGELNDMQDDPEPGPPDLQDEDDGETVSLMKTQFEAYLASLPNCVNRDLIDKSAIQFCMNFNTKISRKKLVKALFSVHRNRYDLLPFYARFVATLHPCMPDIASELAHFLKSDFKWHVRKKDQINIESKLKTVRFIGEMVKFKMFQKSEALHCVKMLLFDFSHHNIEMACGMLETCGRFLYRSPDSHHRTKVYLDVMMRKKEALHLDSRYTAMIENAYFYSNPPDSTQIVRKIRPPMHEYIRKLLFKDMSKITTEKVLRQMRKLDWDDDEISAYAKKCLTAVWNVRFNSIHCSANLLAGLAPYHEHVAIEVVDCILEDIRIGMEVNHPRYNQRRVSCMKFLGELYNYRMVESAVVFKVLYSLICFGVYFDDTIPSPIDQPEHLFRLRLVCTLLDTCGQYFDKGSSKRKLDCFLTYFLRYYWFKKHNPIWTEERPFPINVINMFSDTMEMVRPKLKLPDNYEEASKAADELDKECMAKIASLMPKSASQEADGQEEGNLTTITEDDENDDLSQTNVIDDGPSTVESDISQDEDLSRSQTGSQAERAETESQNDEDEDDDVLESAGEDEAEDQVTVLTGGPRHINCQEDDDFMSAFDKMLTDSIQARSHESIKVPQLDISVPMHLKGQKKAVGTPPQVFSPLYNDDSLPAPTELKQDDDSVNFVLMTRKGNKQQFSSLKVPVSEELAEQFKEREKAERAEKERMKQVVLNIHERQEEEDYQEMIAAISRNMSVNPNREKRVRYQHPKGAPDADLIFGSKSATGTVDTKPTTAQPSPGFKLSAPAARSRPTNTTPGPKLMTTTISKSSTPTTSSKLATGNAGAKSAAATQHLSKR